MNVREEFAIRITEAIIQAGALESVAEDPKEQNVRSLAIPRMALAMADDLLEVMAATPLPPWPEK